MQEDVHYYLIKVLAQEAGFSPDDAQIVAYASQYADDAVEHQPLRIKKLPTELNFGERTRGEYFVIRSALPIEEFSTSQDLTKMFRRRSTSPFIFSLLSNTTENIPTIIAVFPTEPCPVFWSHRLLRRLKQFRMKKGPGP